MSLFSKKLVQVLEDRFRVAPEFSAQLVPLFERFAERRPSSAEWEDMLGRVAAAFHSNSSGNPLESEAVGEAGALIGEFMGEIQKIDECLKVLGAYLQRMRQHLEASAPPVVVH